MAKLADWMLMTFQSRILAYNTGIRWYKYTSILEYASVKSIQYLLLLLWKTQGPRCPSVQQLSIRESESIMRMLLKERHQLEQIGTSLLPRLLVTLPIVLHHPTSTSKSFYIYL